MLKRIAVILLIILPGMSISCDGRESLRHIYDSLEKVQMPAREVKFRCSNIYEITVSDQQQFDRIAQTLKTALQNGRRNIRVKVKPGIYFFREALLTLDNQHYPDADIRIVGNGVTVIPKGRTLRNGDELPDDASGESSYVDLYGRSVYSPWGEMMYADAQVEVLNVKAKRCRLKCSALKGVNVPEGNHAYLDLTRWCRCYQYKVEKIEDGNVYFRAHDLGRDSVFHKDGYNVNYDYIFAGANPRFRLCNLGRLSLPHGRSSVHLGDASVFMCVRWSEFHAISVKGFTFLGGKPSVHALMLFKETKASDIEIAGCTFAGQMGRIVSAYSTDNLLFRDNYVTKNYEWGFLADNMCTNTYVVDNVFEDNGLGLSYARCVTCMGKDYYIARNTFKNFGYCAVSVGLYYGDKKKCPPCGIVENNHMYYDAEHFNNAWKYTIMDSGAIYLWTQNDGAIIRYNNIHDYTGMSENRGIFCDDGASGFSLYGNVVMNVNNWYAIDSRRVAGTERGKNARSFAMRNNVNNVVMYNVTDGTINFVGREEKSNGCFKGANVLLKRSGDQQRGSQVKTTYKNLEKMDGDTEVSESRRRARTRALKKVLPCYGKMKI